jgi:hypothetical protein
MREEQEDEHADTGPAPVSPITSPEGVLRARLHSSLKPMRECERFGDAAAVGGQFAAASVVFANLRDEFRRCEDRQVVAEAEEVLVAGDQERAPADGEREQIVVVGVR